MVLITQASPLALNCLMSATICWKSVWPKGTYLPAEMTLPEIVLAQAASDVLDRHSREVRGT